MNMAPTNGVFAISATRKIPNWPGAASEAGGLVAPSLFFGLTPWLAPHHHCPCDSLTGGQSRRKPSVHLPPFPETEQYFAVVQPMC